MAVSAEEAVSYRTPLAVTDILRLPNGWDFPVCPRCKITLEREYQHFCDRCGQCLDWNNYDNAVLRYFESEDNK